MTSHLNTSPFRCLHLLHRLGLTLALISIAGTARAELLVSGLWVRSMPPNQTMTAGYGVITNTGSKAITLSGASSAIAARVEFHESVRDGDSVRMVPMGTPTLAPGEKLELIPGGAHLMLMGIEQMPAADTTIEVCLTTDAGGNTCTSAPVSRNAPTQSHEMSEHHHHHSMQH